MRLKSGITKPLELRTATCHPWYNGRRYNATLGSGSTVEHGTMYNARLGGTMPPLGSSVDPGDGGSSTIQNSKSRTSIYSGGY